MKISIRELKSLIKEAWSEEAKKRNRMQGFGALDYREGVPPQILRMYDQLERNNNIAILKFKDAARDQRQHSMSEMIKLATTAREAALDLYDFCVANDMRPVYAKQLKRNALLLTRQINTKQFDW
jgi:hypothetical protein